MLGLIFLAASTFSSQFSYAGLSRVEDEWGIEECEMRDYDCNAQIKSALADWEISYHGFMLFGRSLDDDCENFKKDPALNSNLLDRLQTSEKSTYDALKRNTEAQQSLDRLEGADSNSSTTCKAQLKRAKECIRVRKIQMDSVQQKFCSSSVS